MAGLVSGLLAQQRKRLVAGVLGAAERSEWWPKLSVSEQSDFRTRVLHSINGYYEVTLDLLKVSTDEGVLISEDALRLIQATHDRARSMERLLTEEE